MLTSTRTFVVVDGLGPDTVLYSTRGLKSDLFVKFRNVIMNCNSAFRESLSMARSMIHGEARMLVDR